ncbi:DUF2207 domain-containing protein [Microbacterium aurantiacum]|uniref:DUF2207 domain-containing protein n=1 Tax=Microbacterium aurantiacum TaxID=162393 RepID=UPI003D708BC7
MATRRLRSLFGARAAGVVAIAAALTATTGMIGAGAASAEPVSTVSTDVDDFTFDSMDVDYSIGRGEDGASALTVAETFVARFPEYDQNRGMRRIVPDSYLGAPLNPRLISITDAEGNPRASETDSDDGAYAMTSRADDYVRGEQSYVFTYTLDNVVRFFDDTGVQEFYWDVNGVDWAQPFGEVSATLRVPAELADSLTGDQACYVGTQGSTQTCDISVQPGQLGAVLIEASARDLAPYETMTIAVGFAPDTFTPFDGSYVASPLGWLQAAFGALGLGALGCAIAVRRRHLRDAPGRPTIIAEYAPPPNIDALESAVLLGKTAKAIPAEVLEQAVVGSIRIEEAGKKTFGGVKLKAVLIDPSRADGDGRMLLDGLFPQPVPGAEYEFGSSDTRFSTAARKILSLADKELTTRGLRRPVPAGTRAWPMILSILAAIGATIFGVLALEAYLTPAVTVPVLIGSFLLVFLVAGLISRRPLTSVGAETRDHLAGLKTFIEWAEADRIRMLQSPRGAERRAVDAAGDAIDPDDPRQMLVLYEKLLPYAVVFGQEKEWADRLAVLYDRTGTPGWYVGTTGFNAAAFSSGISSLSATASASTSGGSSGGGSAGGGGGGGGGGGV